ncbi:Fe-S protein assembly co-chaperone HscB [Neisseria sp. 23W00296]|uniref:Fe-S protein assembly co-chaperone HscB n=1 Tax=unclassified Neisseria TaxID=2623750 RepID=UPI003756806B
MSQYFDLFQLPEGFALDEAELETRYRALAARFHPDRYAAASAFEQKQAVMMSATVNEAYRTLKNPTDRAAYLLKEQGIDADAPEHTSFAPEFLMQQMEWRETLMEAQMENEAAALKNLENEIAAEAEKLFAELHQAFADKRHDEAAQLVRQGRFFDKLLREIRQA